MREKIEIGSDFKTPSGSFDEIKIYLENLQRKYPEAKGLEYRNVGRKRK
jgi:hypothetical protein